MGKGSSSNGVVESSREELKRALLQ